VTNPTPDPSPTLKAAEEKVQHFSRRSDSELADLEGEALAGERHRVILRGRAERVLASLIMGVGIALRITHYLANRSFWGDEVAVALNLRFRDFSGLLRPLSYDQTMPLGLLLLFKTTSRVLGFSELALRFLPLLAGCSLVILIWALFRRVLEQRVAFLMLTLVSLSPSLIYYSAEVKQYGIDALVTVLVVWLGIDLLGNSTDQNWRKVTVGGAAALLFSQPIAFVLASIGAAAVVDPRFRSSSTWRKQLATASAVWLGVFLVLYLFSYRATIHSPFMRAFWSPKLLQLTSPSFGSDLSSALGFLLGASEVARIPPLVLGGLFVAGVYAIARKQGPSMAVLAAGPLALVLLASVLKQYPIVIRLVLFAFPLLSWILASGISAVADLVPGRMSDLVFVALAGAFVLPTTRDTVWLARHPHQKEGTRDVVRSVNAEGPTPVYLVFGRYIQWGYYAGDWNHTYLLEQRIDRAAECLRAAQLGYVQGSDERSSNCKSLAFPGFDGRAEEIVGNPPPSAARGAIADESWAAREAARIVGGRRSAVWLFLPDAAAHFIDGFPMRRNLLQKLETDLKAEGCREVEIYAESETLAHKFECPH